MQQDPRDGCERQFQRYKRVLGGTSLEIDWGNVCQLLHLSSELIRRVRTGKYELPGLRRRGELRHSDIRGWGNLVSIRMMQELVGHLQTYIKRNCGEHSSQSLAVT